MVERLGFLVFAQMAWVQLPVWEQFHVNSHYAAIHSSIAQFKLHTNPAHTVLNWL